MSIVNIYDSIKSQHALRNVTAQPVFLGDGRPVQGKKAIVLADTGEAISVVSDRYKVVSNEEVMNATLQAIETAKLDTTDATASVSFSNKGARTMVRIMLPAYSVLSGTNETKMEIVTLNSYDGAWKYSSRAGGIRLACMNGQVMGKMIGSYSQFHNQSLNVQRGAENLVRMIGDFSKSQDWFLAMMNRKADIDDVRTLGSKLLNLPTVQFDESRAGKRLLSLYETYAREMGANAYAVYNTFTDFITHRSRHKSAVASSRLIDENTFSTKVLSSNLFH
jgi:hypothetical protein